MSRIGLTLRWPHRANWRQRWQALAPRLFTGTTSAAGGGRADCALCGALDRQLPDSGSLCAGCHAQLPRLGADACPTCALPGVQGHICGACLSRRPVLDGAVAALRYAFPVPQMIARFKYGAQLHWSAWAVAELAAAVRARQAEAQVDVVVAVPLARQRLAGRGFNQAELLAEGIASACGLRHARGALCRQRDTAPQVGQDREARLRNLRDAFTVSPALAGQRVAVVDDVMTTGATLESVARALRAAGALRVEGWVVARAESHHV